MKKTIIKTDKAPAPIGPYNQAITAGELLYTSGQIAMNPLNNELVLNSIQSETQQVMKNLAAILEEANSSFDQVIKASIFLSDMGNFNEVNEIYGSYFNEETAPARETVQVACLPKNVNVEISVIAIVG